MTTLAQIERELARIGLLMQHDRELPSVTTLVAGEPIAGSWWGHARGAAIYDLLTRFEDGAGRLSVKLVAGKITYIDRALWPAFFTLTASVAKRARTRSELSAPARALLALLQKRGELRLDELAASGFAPQEELTASCRELELALLAQVGSVHTASGTHAKALRSWPDWAKEHAPRMKRPSLAVARAALSEAVARLAADAKHAPEVPLLAR